MGRNLSGELLKQRPPRVSGFCVSTAPAKRGKNSVQRGLSSSCQALVWMRRKNGLPAAPTFMDGPVRVGGSGLAASFLVVGSGGGAGESGFDLGDMVAVDADGFVESFAGDAPLLGPIVDVRGEFGVDLGFAAGPCSTFSAMGVFPFPGLDARAQRPALSGVRDIGCIASAGDVGLRAGAFQAERR